MFGDVPPQMRANAPFQVITNCLCSIFSTWNCYMHTSIGGGVYSVTFTQFFAFYLKKKEKNYK